MLSLESDEWGELEHAYGDASDVPDLLRSLEADNVVVFKSPLANLIFHQSFVYEASIAAVPHIVELIQKSPDERRDDLIFVGMVAANANAELLDSLDDDITAAYAEALRKIASLSVELLQSVQLGIDEFCYLLVATIAVNGWPKLARFFHGFPQDEFVLACPECESELFVRPSEEMSISFEGSMDGGVLQTKIQAYADGEFQLADVEFATPETFRWLQELLSKTEHSSMIDQIRCLFGTVRCPNSECQQEFRVLDGFPSELFE